MEAAADPEEKALNTENNTAKWKLKGKQEKCSDRLKQNDKLFAASSKIPPENPTSIHDPLQHAVRTFEFSASSICLEKKNSTCTERAPPKNREIVIGVLIENIPFRTPVKRGSHERRNRNHNRKEL